jgi:CheY-like chemotaxis protein
MNTTASANRTGAGPQSSAIDITPLARRAGIRYPTSVSPGIAEFYRLSADNLPMERGDLNDLAWAVSLGLHGSMPTRPLPWKHPASLLVEFPSFVHGQPDATSVALVATVRLGRGGHEWLYLSRVEEDVPATVPLVLLVEADPQIAALTSGLLRKHAIEVITAVTGADGIQRASECQPDLILLDEDLPDIDGIAVCARLRADPARARVPILISSAWHHTKSLAFKAGANGYLEKPLDLLELPERIQKALNVSPEAAKPE